MERFWWRNGDGEDVFKMEKEKKDHSTFSAMSLWLENRSLQTRKQFFTRL